LNLLDLVQMFKKTFFYPRTQWSFNTSMLFQKLLKNWIVY